MRFVNSELLYPELFHKLSITFSFIQELSREREIISRLKVEKNEEVTRADSRKADIDRLQLEIGNLSRKIGDMKIHNTASEEKWNEERTKLQVDLLHKEKEIQRMRCIASD